MIGSQVKLSIRPNNQTTITIGDWTKKILLPSTSAINEHDKVCKRKLTNLAQKYRYQREYFSDACENRQKLFRPNLDIIQKKETPPKIIQIRQNTPKSFTRISGQKLRECGAAMDILSRGNLEECYEICLTLPANHEKAFTALAQNTYFATHRIFSYLKKQYNGEVSWFYVWEYQKRGALHLHMAVHHRASLLLPTICSDIKRAWIRILQDIGENSECCMFTDKSMKKCVMPDKWQMHSAQIRKSVGSYFSKYAGKEESKQSWYCQKYPISRFWGSSKKIKQVIAENSVEATWDFQGDLESAEKFHAELLEKIVLSMRITKITKYNFCVTSKHSNVARKDDRGNIRLYPIDPKIYASGERITAYCLPEDFRKVINCAKSVQQCF
jgi:hypothetical protein